MTDAFPPLDTLDPRTPNVARVLNCLRSGKDNFPRDREIAAQILTVAPEVKRVIHDQRGFGERAIRLMGESGVDQFLDIGCALPTPPHPNTHEIARKVQPGARVAYVDNDAMVVTHRRAFAAGEGTAAVLADLRDPDSILSHPHLREIIDWAYPVGILVCAVLQFVDDGADPYGCVGRLVDHMAPGSFLAISHGEDSPRAREIAALYANSSAPGWPRSATELRWFFDGLEIVEPGVCGAANWRPLGPRRHVKYSEDLRFVAGVGRKR